MKSILLITINLPTGIIFGGGVTGLLVGAGFGMTTSGSGETGRGRGGGGFGLLDTGGGLVTFSGGGSSTFISYLLTKTILFVYFRI